MVQRSLYRLIRPHTRSHPASASGALEPCVCHRTQLDYFFYCEFLPTVFQAGSMLGHENRTLKTGHLRTLPKNKPKIIKSKTEKKALRTDLLVSDCPGKWIETLSPQIFSFWVLTSQIHPTFSPLPPMTCSLFFQSRVPLALRYICKTTRLLVFLESTDLSLEKDFNWLRCWLL